MKWKHTLGAYPCVEKQRKLRNTHRALICAEKTRRLRNTLCLVGLIILLLFGFVEAYFTDRGVAAGLIGTAKIKITEAGMTGCEKPEVVTKETEFRFFYQMQNSGTAAAYIEDSPKILLDGKIITEQDGVELIRLDGQQAWDDTKEKKKIDIGEKQTFSYCLRLGNVEMLEKEKISLEVYAQGQAFTGKGRTGFSSEKLEWKVLDFTGDNELPLPVKERRIQVKGKYTAGNQAFREVWYCSSERKTGPGDRMTWEVFDAKNWITVSKKDPFLCRFELISDVGTVRSDMYLITFQDGQIKTQSYDFFTGAEK